MKKILIPTDFSEISKNAIQYAMQLYQETPCHFFLLYVNVDGMDYTEKPVYDLGTNIVVEKEPKNIEQKLRKLEKSLKSNSPQNNIHRFTTLHEAGYFLESIRKQVQEKEIELIVMGTKGANELKEFFMGSITGDVITKVECDVLVIPEKAKYQSFKEVVFPVDFEISYTEDILKTIADFVASQKARVRLLYVTKSQTPLLKEVEIRQTELAQSLSEIVKNTVSFHKVISKKVEEGVQTFAESVHADLIIMISKDHSFLHKQFLDTTVEEVSFDTVIPLLSLKS